MRVPTHTLALQINIHKTLNTRAASKPINRKNSHHRTIHYFSSSATNNENDSERTLYQILNASPSATRSELKSKYIQLAKILHPDAAMSQQAAAGLEVEFSQVADAWAILSDPQERKRYDRKLKAREISREIERAAAEVTDQAIPIVANLFQTLNPIWRRTTATTSAAARAVIQEVNTANSVATTTTTQDVNVFDSTTAAAAAAPTPVYDKRQQPTTRGRGFGNQYKTITNTTSPISISSQPAVNPRAKLDLAKAVSSALQAGRNASRIIDNLDLLEKSKELEEKWQKNMDKAFAIRQRLQNVTEERLKLSIYTPNSEIDSYEARLIMSGFNYTDTLTLMDNMLLRNTVEEQINYLNKKEDEYAERFLLKQEIQNKYDADEKALMQVQQNLRDARETEARARAALEAAIQVVASTKLEIAEKQRIFVNTQTSMQNSNKALETATLLVKAQREKVREALLKKDKERRVNNNSNNAESSNPYPNISEASALDKIQDLKLLEERLTSDAIILEDRADKELLRAERIRESAESKLRSLTMNNNTDASVGRS